MIFVDTSVWYAAYVAEEPEHAAADALLVKPSGRLITTDYVIDELLTLLAARGYRPLARLLGRLLFSENLVDIVWSQPSDVKAAWQVFDTFDDKQWSFTDCVSYVVMKRLNVTEAFALDDDFRQFGFVAVRP